MTRWELADILRGVARRCGRSSDFWEQFSELILNNTEPRIIVMGHKLNVDHNDLLLNLHQIIFPESNALNLQEDKDLIAVYDQVINLIKGAYKITDHA